MQETKAWSFFCLLNDGLDLNRDESDQDYVGTVEPLLQKPVQNTETEVSSPVLVQATQAPALEPNAPDPDSAHDFLPTPTLTQKSVTGLSSSLSSQRLYS
jgi:hypothetical protein